MEYQKKPKVTNDILNHTVTKLSFDLVKKIYAIRYPEHERNNVQDQICRAGVSILANYGESIRDGKNLYFNCALYHLNVSLGSAYETKVLLALCLELGYLSQQEYLDALNVLDQIIYTLDLYTEKIPEYLCEKALKIPSDFNF